MHCTPRCCVYSRRYRRPFSSPAHLQYKTAVDNAADEQTSRTCEDVAVAVARSSSSCVRLLCCPVFVAHDCLSTQRKGVCVSGYDALGWQLVCY